MRDVDISVIIPLLNEEKSLEELYRRLTVTLRPLGDYELIFVDDGSRDGSFQVLKQLHGQDNKVSVLQFRINMGKATALSAGFQEARGKTIVTIDADLQDLPEEIPALLAGLKDYDMVSGWKYRRKDSCVRRFLSLVFNKVTAKIAKIEIHDFNCGLKCYRRQVIEEIRIYGELHRYIPVFAGWKGFQVGERKIEHCSRRYGKSRYGAERIFRGFFDLLTALMLSRYSAQPVHFFGGVGMLTALVGVVINVYLSIGWFFGKWIGHRPLFILGVLMIIIGVQFVFFGLLAELITYHSPKDEPFPIREKLKARD